MHRPNRLLRLLLPPAASLIAWVVLAPGAARAQQVFYNGPSQSYGSPFDSNAAYAPSQLDVDARRRDMQKEADRRALRERQQARSDARVKAAWDASSQPYTPPKPENEGLIMNNMEANRMTVDQVADSIVASQQKAAQASVAIPPKVPGKTMVVVNDDFYYYGEGVFYIDNGGELAEVPAPVGAIVSKIPTGFETLTMQDGSRLFKVGESYFQRQMIGGKPGFRVVPRPGLVADPAPMQPTLPSDLND